MERLARAVELRAEGRRLSGIVMPYGEISPSHRERFEPGAFRMAGTIPLNLRHDAERACGWYPDGGVALDDGRDALRMVATLPAIPAADRALAEVASRRLGGLSVEFRAERERRDGGIRVIEAARLIGIGLVAAPSYAGAGVEARDGAWAEGGIDSGTVSQCRCASPCTMVRFQPGAWDSTVRAAREGERDIAAQAGSLAAPDILASTRAGTLRLDTDRAGGLLAMLIGASRATPAAAAIMATAAAAPPLVRPILDDDASTWQEVDVDGQQVRDYSDAHLRSLLVKWADAPGWRALRIVGAPVEPAPGPPRRPIWL